VCIAAGLSVPTPELRSDGALMVNLLGLDTNKAAPLDQRLTALREIPNAHLHWYGKSPETPGRKLGHITVLLNSSDADHRQRQAIDVLAVVRGIWPVFPTDQD
jgi:5-(carboxyamino)imidazole ribonucleotide synthase